MAGNAVLFNVVRRSMIFTGPGDCPSLFGPGPVFFFPHPCSLLSIHRWLSRTSLLGLPGILALAVLALDQASKLLVCAIWPQPGSGQLVLIPGFLRIVHWRNPGAAWGIFSDHTWMLAALSLAAAAAIVIFFRTITEGKAILAIPFGVLLGGIIGNFIDRAFYAGGVIDFIRFEF